MLGHVATGGPSMTEPESTVTKATTIRRSVALGEPPSEPTPLDDVPRPSLAGRPDPIVGGIGVLVLAAPILLRADRATDATAALVSPLAPTPSHRPMVEPSAARTRRYAEV